MIAKPAIALLSGCSDRCRALEAALTQNDSGFLVLCAASRLAALRLLTTHEVGVLISDVQLRDGDWRDFLSDTARMARPPRLVVVARAVDRSLWAEVLNLGGYDVLVEPLNSEEIRRVAASAMRNFVGAHETVSRKPAGSEKAPMQFIVGDRWRECSKRAVLVVGNRERSRADLESCFRADGFDVLFADNGAQGLALFHDHARCVSCVVAEWEAPGMRCDELCDRILADKPDVQFFVWGEQPLSEVKRRFAANTMPEYLQAPLAPSAVKELLRAARAA